MELESTNTQCAQIRLPALNISQRHQNCLATRREAIAMSQTQEQPSFPPNVPTILITGAFSGLGRAFFEHFATASRAESSHDAPPAFNVIGIDRQPWPDKHGNPQPSHAHGPNSAYVQADITQPQQELEALIRRWIGTESPLKLVIHSAGVRGLVPSVPLRRSDDVAAAETLGVIDAATMMGTFEINVVGALNVVRAVLPSLRVAAARGLNPSVVVMSSRMGSVAANSTGGGYAYRASKAALNTVVRSMSIDIPEVCFALVHPGRVETGLVSIKEDGAMTCEESLRTMLPVLDRLGEGHLRSGCFVDRFGVEIPW